MWPREGRGGEVGEGVSQAPEKPRSRSGEEVLEGEEAGVEEATGAEAKGGVKARRGIGRTKGNPAVQGIERNPGVGLYGKKIEVYLAGGLL